MTGPAAAKNAMAVGAVNADKAMSNYSNWGPTDDGRVKPDIVARGTGIDSAQATSPTAYSGSGEDSSGTSYASPAAAAAGLLLQQYYSSVDERGLHALVDTQGPDAWHGGRPWASGPRSPVWLGVVEYRKSRANDQEALAAQCHVSHEPRVSDRRNCRQSGGRFYVRDYPHGLREGRRAAGRESRVDR